MKSLPPIQGKNLYLAPFPKTEAFYKEYRQWLNSARVKHGVGGEEDYSIQEVKELLQEWEEDPQNRTWGIFESKTKEIIGDISLRWGYEEYDNDGPEILVMIGKHFGQGYGTEAMRTLMHYAFDKLKIKIINGGVYHDNPASIAMNKKLGFEFFKEQVDEDNGRAEWVIKMTKERWEKLKATSGVDKSI